MTTSQKSVERRSASSRMMTGWKVAAFSVVLGVGVPLALYADSTKGGWDLWTLHEGDLINEQEVNDNFDKLGTFAQTYEDAITVTADGKVGIGTKTPTAPLDVNGTISARGIFPDYNNGLSQSVNTVYQATSNGYLSVVAWGPFMNDLDIQVGPTSSTAILIWRMGDDLNSNTKGSSALIPVKKGTYYRVASPGSAWIQQYPYENVVMTFFAAN